MGKGDGRRVEDSKKIDANWARAFGKKVDAHGPTWTDTTPYVPATAPTLDTVMCACGHSAREHMQDCGLCRADDYACGCDKDQGDVLLAALVTASGGREAEIVIADYDEQRELYRLARIARHLRDVFPKVYRLVERELADGVKVDGSRA